ncbi:27907_t:CDS:2, partial [Gigaspora margarita]
DDEKEYYEILFYNDIENKYTSYFDKNKKELIPAKKDRNEKKNNKFLYNYYNVLQTLFKELANSIYGQFWSKTSFFRNYMISSAITAFGRNYLVKVLDFAKSRFVKDINESEFIW